jgi:hypothetical protein
MAHVRKVSIALLAASVVFVAVGYVSARSRLEECRSQIAQQLVAKPVFGRNFGGSRVQVAPSAVSSRVAGLFQVETVYMVPTGMHGTLYIQRFTTLPWGIERSTSQVIYLV